ncbi:hypothetical protein BCV70DRAFT_201758 [Testicularia cyperi]|uniref:Palmitoyltransferase n=1 Tax=Testicularia cyperi TaxID=1882483 RepID=A0A317XJH8_9BASI|nr:hypothetical protein BCV70DRAFT_201758 [Testicularia cyperi]
MGRETVASSDTDGPSGSAISTSSHTHVEHRYIEQPKMTTDVVKEDLPASHMPLQAGAVPPQIPTDTIATRQSTMPSNRNASERPPPPECMQNCLTSIEDCTANVARFNDRLELSRVNAQAERLETGDPLYVKKATVPLVFVILSWVFLAYVWRLCSRLIQQTPQGRVLGTRSEGVGLLVGFAILWLMAIAAYIRVISTGPGLVKDYVTESNPPIVNQQSGTPQWAVGVQPPVGPMPIANSRPQSGVADTTGAYPSSFPTSSSLAYPMFNADLEHFGGQRASNDSMRVLPGSVEPRHLSETKDSDFHVAAFGGASTHHNVASEQADASVADVEGRRDQQEPLSGPVASVDSEPQDPSLPGIVGPMGAGALAAAQGVREEEQQQQQRQTAPRPIDVAAAQSGQAQPNGMVAVPQSPSLWAAPQRRPPNDPAPLSDAAMYCHRCRRLKPPRAHHCRRCGTCVLKMDHHCPWVGGCVGAQNQRFFFVFVFWVTLLEWYTLISTAVYFHRGVRYVQTASSTLDWKVDGFLISLFPISAIFGIFTTALLVTHIYLMSRNMTTIEHMGISRISGRERVLVDRWFGMEANRDKSGFKNLKAKREMVREFDREWGGLSREGNLWWIGGRDELDFQNSSYSEPSQQHNQTNTDQLQHPEQSQLEKTSHHPQTATSTSRTQRQINGKGAWKTNLSLALGSNPLLWILPLGRTPKHAGLEYPRNPRFGQDGVWRPRSEWPPELR